MIKFDDNLECIFYKKKPSIMIELGFIILFMRILLFMGR